MTSSQQRRALRLPIEAINAANARILEIVVRLLVEAGLSEQDALFRARAAGSELRRPLGDVAIACVREEA